MGQKATRAEVYAALDSEREYQDQIWPERDIPDQPNNLTIGEFLVLIGVYLRKAEEEWAVEPKPELNTLEVVRKIGGIAVNCMEQHGAPHRK